MTTKEKSVSEVNSMREAGKILAHVLHAVQDFAAVGHSTKDLAEFAQRQLKRYPQAKPSFLGYQGFPDVLCVSVNEEVIHGIPRTQKILEDGDIVSIDFGVTINSMIVDAARTFVVGKTNSTKKLLLQKTEESLLAGIKVVKDTANISTIGSVIEESLSKSKLGIIREFVGHGVGHQLHEEPGIPNYASRQSFILRENMTIAIEPMATLGGEDIVIDSDGWTVRTADASMSAHFEDTVLVTKKGFEILTRI